MCFDYVKAAQENSTQFSYLHNKKGYKFFCFSNIFSPAGSSCKTNIRYIIMSSPSKDFNKIRRLNGIPYASTYAATKHAVVGLTKSAALDYATKNIRVNAVAPGAIRTDIILQQMNFGTYDENKVIEMFPMKRMGNPQEIANGIA